MPLISIVDSEVLDVTCRTLDRAAGAPSAVPCRRGRRRRELAAGPRRSQLLAVGVRTAASGRLVRDLTQRQEDDLQEGQGRGAGLPQVPSRPWLEGQVPAHGQGVLLQ